MTEPENYEILEALSILDYWENRLKYHDDEEYLTKEKILTLIEKLRRLL